MNTDKIKITAGYILICLIWGSTWLGIRFGLNSFTPLISSGLRFSLASLFVFIVMRTRKISLQTDSKSLKLYGVLGLFSFAVPFALVYWGEQYVPSGLASILFGIFPFGVLIFSMLAFRNQKISFGQFLGVVLGFAGIVIIFSEGLSLNFSQHLFGIIAILLSATIQAAIAVVVKKYGKHLNPLSMNFIPLIIAGVVLVASAFIFEDSSTWHFDFNGIASVVYLALFGTVVTFTTYYWLMQRINVVVLALSSFITPIIAVILGWIIVNEKLSSHTILGSSCVLIGILFANFKGIKNYYRNKNLSVR